jgi:enamine deaminase RidA (YjgF/YER057c/UK114 family)
VPRRLISSGSRFEREYAYSRAVVDGRWIFVSGTTGFDYSTMTIAADVVAQAEQCMKNIAAALAEAGSSLDDVVRVRYILPRKEDFQKCAPVLARYLCRARPASTMFEAKLIEDRILIEVEVTALKPSPDAP